MKSVVDPARHIFINGDSVMNSNRETEFIPPGNWGGFILEIIGTTDAAETLLLTDIGNVELVYDGSPQQDASYEFFHAKTDLDYGRPNFPTGSAAQSEEVSAIIPIGANGYANSLMVQGKREAWINLKFDALLDTRFGGAGTAGRYELWGIPVEDTFQSYFLNVKRQNFEANGATRVSDPLSARNLLSVYIKDESPSVIDDVSLNVDGQQITDKVPFRTLLTSTNMANQIENSGNEWAEIVVATEAKAAAENQNSKMEIAFTGAGTAEVILVYADWLPANVAAQNMADVSAKLKGKARGLRPGRA